MVRREPNDRLGILLAEAGLTGEALARAVNTAGAENGLSLSYTRKAVARWRSGSRPPAPVPALIAEILTRRLGRTITTELIGMTDVEAPDQLPPAVTGGPGHSALAALTAAEADPARRAALHNLPYSLARVPPMWAEAHARGVRARTAGSVRVGRGEADALRYMTGFFLSAIDRYGGGHARMSLAAYLANDATAFLSAESTEETRRELLTRTSELAVVLARMTIDCGSHGFAQHYLRIAAQLACEAGDSTQYAIVLRAASSHAHQLGHVRSDLAEAALDTAPRSTSPGIRSFLLSQLAVAHAATGSVRPAVHALSMAEDIFDEERSDGCEGQSGGKPFAGYPAAGLHYQRAQVLRALGDQGTAISALRASSRLRPKGARRARTLTLAQLAQTLLSVGHLDAACGIVHKLLDDLGESANLHSHKAHESFARLRQHLQPHRGYPPAYVVLRRLSLLEPGTGH